MQQLQPSASARRAASTWGRSTSRGRSHDTSNTAAGAVFLLLAAAGAAQGWAVRRASEEGEGAGAAWCGPSKVDHTLYVTGSTR